MGAAYRPPSMTEMVQMIAALGDLQESRKRREQSAQEFKQSQDMLAQRLGFEKGSERWKQALDALQTLSTAPTETRQATASLLTAMGLPQELTPMVQELIAKAPETAANFANRNVQQGFASMSPQQQQAVQQQAASTTLSGMNTGQVGQAGVNTSVTGSLQDYINRNPQFLQQLGVGAANAQFAPVQGAVAQQQLSQPGAIANLARLAGGGMTEAQAAGAQTEAQSVAQTGAYQQTESLLRSLAMNSKTPISVSEASKMMPDLNNLLTLTQNPKFSDAARRQARLQYNSMKRMMQAAGLDLSSLPDLNPNQP